MKLPAAYLAVVLIWSTTPLTIVWSTESIHPSLAVFLRMLIALVLCFVLLAIFRIRLPWHSQAVKLYSYSSIGIFGGMLLSYFAAQYLASGLMSLIFGLSPIVSGMLERKLLNGKAFTWMKKLAFALAVLGLLLVCSENISLNQYSWLGILLILAAMGFFSLSGVLVKGVNISIHPVATTTGALCFCTPAFALVWWLTDGSLMIEQWSNKSLFAVVYLGVFGSLIGFVSYFYILQRLPATTVALVTLITPVMALTLGAWLNNESITVNIIQGALLILIGLALYQFGDKVLNRKFISQGKSAD